MNKKEIIPKQKKGFKVNHSKSFIAGSKNDAENIYCNAKKLLLEINNWDKLTGAVPSYFALCDNKGILKKGIPSIGDYVRIGIPAPSSIEGKGFDWVALDNFRSEENDNENNVFLSLRPSPNPLGNNNSDTGIAHFFSKRSTSNFIIEQKNNVVVASYYGRNEFPNIKDAKRLFDKVRNILVAVGGLVGLSRIQWKSFIDNIIDNSVSKQ